MLGLKADQEVLGELVKAKVPGVWRTMLDQNVMWTLVVSRWFICLYIDVLPVEVRGLCRNAVNALLYYYDIYCMSSFHMLYFNTGTYRIRVITSALCWSGWV